MIKNNPPELIKLDWGPNPNIILESMDPEQFHEHYQKLALIREEQEHSSSVQNGNSNNNTNSNSDLNPEQYIVLPNFFKEQKLKWFSNNNEGIMPEYVHNTDTEFDLRYPRKNAIKLESYSHTCIDLKIVLKIPAMIMIQLASKNSLTKKGIYIKRGIINAGYIGNIIVMLQNDSEKAYIIKPNEKIAQTIFLPLIPEETTIGYLTTEIEDQLPDTIPDFSQLYGYIRRMLFAPTRTIGTDELGKSRLTTMYAIQDVTQQLQ
ncbi:hypothetical protein G9A89_000861 [Geosiphon pyriformis]|nr:hypothetical protein G9A89_000861 [Geosiphon pyriformis]